MTLNADTTILSDPTLVYGSALIHGEAAWNQKSKLRLCSMLSLTPPFRLPLRSNRNAHRCCQLGEFSIGTWRVLCAIDRE